MSEKQKYSILVCDCGEQYSIKRPQEDERGILRYECNWCPACMERSHNPYNERKIYKQNKD